MVVTGITMYFDTLIGRIKLASLALMLILLCLLIPLLVQQVGVPRDDFIAYWAAGRLNALGENPYEPAQIFRVQKDAGWPAEYPSLVWYPPWALPLLMPLGLLSYLSGRLVWLFLSLLILFVNVLWLWRIYNGPPRHSWQALAVAGAFSQCCFH